MLNSIYVRTSVRPFAKLVIIGEMESLLTAIATVGFRRSPERSSSPILIYYDGYYPWANSVVSVRFVYGGYYPMSG